VIERWRPANFGLPFPPYCYLTKPTISFYYMAFGQDCRLGEPALSLSPERGFSRTASHLSGARSQPPSRRPLTCFVSFNFYALPPPGVPAQKSCYLAQVQGFPSAPTSEFSSRETKLLPAIRLTHRDHPAVGVGV